MPTAARAVSEENAAALCTHAVMAGGALDPGLPTGGRDLSHIDQGPEAQP